MNLMNLLALSDFYAQFLAISIVMLIVTVLLAVVAIIFILMQPSNSDGINAITGSSETFFGKNKGKSIEARMKKWTVICLVAIIVLSIIFYLLPIIFA
ncbi:MAG: preprotein translocase subunit SecG [Clostridia bacterium]|nr:preprotein translocase subunit SecG [Clostridia bacterium]